MIINDANGKYYVGKTVSSDLDGYFRRTVREAKSGKMTKPALYNAIRKYGADKFRIHPLMSTLVSNEQLCEQEKFLIGLFKAQARTVGYNIADGGDGVTVGGANGFYGKTHSADTRAFLANLAGNTFRGKPKSKEQVANMTKALLANGAERGAAISKALKGVPKSDAQKQAQRVAMIGRTTSEETRKKMSDSHKARWQEKRVSRAQ